MSDIVSQLETAAGALLAQESRLTPERIREVIDQFRIIPLFNVDDESAELLARRFETRHNVSMTLGSILTEQDYEPWLEDQRAGIDFYYWDRYRRLLGDNQFSSQVIATLDEVTSRILGLLENPGKAGKWDRRGLVVGHVQSGKTANYTGLICKAADAGYKVIIVIAGIHNNLRNQTQARIDEGFVGRDSTTIVSQRGVRVVGVGRYGISRQPWTFTNSLRDFNKRGAEQVGGKLSGLAEPAVFVIKKNSSTLKNLLEWLKQHNARGGIDAIDSPMLIIDDEADNASINTKHGLGEVTRINGQIRELLHMFNRSCYVGYTATPFANIFIDPDSDDEMRGDDLFPRHFIASLDPPSNYFGPRRVFVEDSDKYIRHIDDNEGTLPLKHRIDTRIGSLPPSLITAMRTFLVARAIRLVRGHEGQHCSMLVNASRFTNVQSQIRNELHIRLSQVHDSVRAFAGLPVDRALADPEIQALHAVWKDEFSNADVAWESIQTRLLDAVAPVSVIEVNSASSGALNYADYEATGRNVIAVGGYSLSRGLTLEGLMVSYFLRNSMMYDTLMQMGRWFGYRPGYDDLCRVWMTEDAEGWYEHIAESIELLRGELRMMEAAGATPEQFGLRVRSHPDTLIVTARNKMGTSERVVMNIGLGNSFVETATLCRDAQTLDENYQAVHALADRLAATGTPVTMAMPVRGSWLVRNASAGPVLEFLSTFRNHPGSVLTDPDPIRRYIQDRRYGELASWDILFVGIERAGTGSLIDRSLGIDIICQQRTAGDRNDKSDQTTLRITKKQRVSSRGIERIGVADDQVRAAEEAFRISNPRVGAESRPWNYPDRIYRERRERPLLVVHLLDVKSTSPGPEQNRPVAAWSISFPRTELEEKRVEFVVNMTWLRENYREDIDEDEMSGDRD